LDLATPAPSLLQVKLYELVVLHKGEDIAIYHGAEELTIHALLIKVETASILNEGAHKCQLEQLGVSTDKRQVDALLLMEETQQPHIDKGFVGRQQHHILLFLQDQLLDFQKVLSVGDDLTECPVPETQKEVH
jgi:hypothetical protein